MKQTGLQLLELVIFQWIVRGLLLMYMLTSHKCDISYIQFY